MQQDPIGTVHSTADLGAIVRSLRKAQGARQVDLASFAQTGERFVVELEAGKPTIRLDKVLGVLELLGVELVVVKRSPKSTAGVAR